MAQKKMLRFAQLTSSPNCLEKPEDMPGKWADFFKNDNPVTLELACGRGEYTIGLAKMYPHRNFIGVDIKGNRMVLGAKTAIEENLHNVAFLRTEIEKIADYFTSGEVEEIWITFPDPQLRTSKAKKRLTHPRFLRSYKQILKPAGYIHLKTDSPGLYAFSQLVIDRYELNLIAGSEDVYHEVHDPELDIKTHYEKLDIAQSNKIFYLKFSLPHTLRDDDAAFYELLKQTEPADA